MSINFMKKVLIMRTRRSKLGRVMPNRSSSSSNMSKSNNTTTLSSSKRTTRNTNTKVKSKILNSQSTKSKQGKISKSNKNVKTSENDNRTSDVSVVKTKKNSTRSKGTVKNNNVVTSDKPNIVKKSQVKETSMKQLSLQESFSNQTARRLRPRKNINNNKDPISNREKSNKPKTPVYKCVNFYEDSSISKDDVYTFNFDVNDSTEHLVRKKRKRVIKHTDRKKTIKAAKLITKQHIAYNQVENNKLIPSIKSKTSEKEMQSMQNKDKIVPPKSDEMRNQIEKDQKTEKVQNVEKEQDIGKVQHEEKEQDIEKVQNVEKEQGIEKVQNVEKKQDIKKIQNVEKKQDIEKVQNLEKKQDIEKVQNAEKLQDTEKVNDIKVNMSSSNKHEVSQNIELGEKESEVQQENINDTSDTQTTKSAISKPKIVSIQDISDNKVVVMNKSTPNNVKPFRPTNVFKRQTLQHKSMINDSLLNKSLSPIQKASENFDTGSPWRPPPLLTFSRVKDIVQSTPQIKMDMYHGRILQNPRKRTLNFANIARKGDTLENSTENTNALKTSNYIGKKENAVSTRKFGTEITNLEKSNVNSIPDDEHMGIEQNRDTEVEFQSQTNLNVTPHHVSTFSDEMDNKENTLPKKPSNKKVRFLKKSKIKNKNKNLLQLQKKSLITNNVKEDVNALSASSSSAVSSSDAQKEITKQPINSQIEKESSVNPVVSKTQEQEVEKVTEHDKKAEVADIDVSDSRQASPDLQNENLEIIDPSDPKPGPSGLQKKNQFQPSKPLRQTNLNTFLNIPEMPQETSIKTSHGIFDDAHSTPIAGKAKKITKEVKTDVENAFGFSDDSDLDISPINPELSQYNVEKKENEVKNVKDERTNLIPPSRLSINQIKNNLLRKNTETQTDIKNEVQNKENVNINEHVEKETNKARVDPVKFSDTFDILSDENEETITDENVPLFVDLEPSHFTEPPKRSYKRKRNVRFSFSENSEEEEEEVINSPEQKKKKRGGKLKKEDEKRVEEWVNSINKTFEEIDHFDLVVE